jgi:hypothetical protein
MADLTITPANVLRGTSGGEIIESGVAGATITAGQVIYRDPSVNTWKLSQCDGTALEAGIGTTLAISLHAALASQPITYIRGGSLGLGAILANGEIYVLSGTPGGIAPIGDLATNDYVVLLGAGMDDEETMRLLMVNLGFQYTAPGP